MEKKRERERERERVTRPRIDYTLITIDVSLKIKVMFKNNDVHNCSRDYNTKKISSLFSCDWIRKEKACLGKTVLSSASIISKLKLKRSESFIFVDCNKVLDNQLDCRCIGEYNGVSGLSSSNRLDDSCEQEHLSRPYPRWFEGAVRYLFSKQLRKCFNLA